MGLVLRLPGLAVGLLAFTLLTVVVWIAAPQNAPSLLQFLLVFVLLQVGYVLGSLLVPMLAGKKQRPKETSSQKTVYRQSGFWLK